MARLAWTLAAVAGALNAGGFMALGYYTSHVTGSLSKVADEAVLGDGRVAAAFAVLAACFITGAFLAGLVLSFGRRSRFKARYAFVLAGESVVLVLFGCFGARWSTGRYLPHTAVVLSLVMGMHNAVATKISKGVVRATHMTGNATDLGIELAQRVYVNWSASVKTSPIRADRYLLTLHSVILLAFVGGGVAGAYAFHAWGYRASFPLALILALLSVRPLVVEGEGRLRWALRRGAGSARTPREIG